MPKRACILLVQDPEDAVMVALPVGAGDATIVGSVSPSFVERVVTRVCRAVHRAVDRFLIAALRRAGWTCVDRGSHALLTPPCGWGVVHIETADHGKPFALGLNPDKEGRRERERVELGRREERKNA